MLRLALFCSCRCCCVDSHESLPTSPYQCVDSSLSIHQWPNFAFSPGPVIHLTDDQTADPPILSLVRVILRVIVRVILRVVICSHESDRDAIGSLSSISALKMHLFRFNRMVELAFLPAQTRTCSDKGRLRQGPQTRGRVKGQLRQGQ